MRASIGVGYFSDGSLGPMPPRCSVCGAYTVMDVRGHVMAHVRRRVSEDDPWAGRNPCDGTGRRVSHPKRFLSWGAALDRLNDAIKKKES